MTRAHAHSRPAVLVVDDDPAVSTTLMWVLRQNGYNSSVARTQEEAFQHCAKLPPDLALIEMNLPDGRGTDAACELHRRLPGCKLLLMSSDPEAGEDFRRAQAAGLDCDLIPKPIPVEELLQRVKETLAQPA